MCTCILEIAAVVYGIMTLVRGRFNYGKTKEVRGAPAYVIGVILLATIPLAVVLYLVLNFDDLQKGGQQPFQWGKLEWKQVLPELIAVIVCWGSALIIAAIKAEPKEDDRYRRREPADADYDDYVDRPRRRRPESDYDETADDRQRPGDDWDDDRRRRRDDLDDRAR